MSLPACNMERCLTVLEEIIHREIDGKEGRGNSEIRWGMII
jgi:hypothetical protein